MARIVTVYTQSKGPFVLSDMSHIRWLKISEALSDLGHEVDIATNEASFVRRFRRASPVQLRKNLRRVPLSRIRWADYDVVKTLFHRGFDTLETFGGANHPFIISKLGSVVAPDDVGGIYFYGSSRKWLYSIQEKINQTSKYITVISHPAKDLWQDCFGRKENILVVPGAVDHFIPPPSQDPFPKDNKPKCLFAGNLYDKSSQPEANCVLVDKLNRLGRLLDGRVRLFVIGPGDIRNLNRKWVTHLGVIPYEISWDYFHFAQVGVVVAAGSFMHNNESSKIYYYLRAGLPVVSERGFPNDHVVAESKLGFVVTNDDLECMAAKIEEAAYAQWDRDFAIQYILENHTWTKRVETYARLIPRETRSLT